MKASELGLEEFGEDALPSQRMAESAAAVLNFSSDNQLRLDRRADVVDKLSFVECVHALKKIELESLTDYRRDLQRPPGPRRQSIEATPHGITDRVGYRKRREVSCPSPPALRVDKLASLMECLQDFFDKEGITLASLLD